MDDQLRITDSANLLVGKAKTCGQQFGFKDPLASHVLIALKACPPCIASSLLEDLGIDVEALCLTVENVYVESDVHTKQSEGKSSILVAAQAVASRHGMSYIGTEHLVLASLLADSPIVETAFGRLHLSVREVAAQVNGRIQETMAREVAMRKERLPGQQTIAEWARDRISRAPNKGPG